MWLWILDVTKFCLKKIQWNLIPDKMQQNLVLEKIQRVSFLKICKQILFQIRNNKILFQIRGNKIKSEKVAMESFYPKYISLSSLCLDGGGVKCFAPTKQHLAFASTLALRRNEKCEFSVKLTLQTFSPPRKWRWCDQTLIIELSSRQRRQACTAID